MPIVFAGGVLTIWTTSIRQSRERTADLLGAQATVARVLASSESLAEAIAGRPAGDGPDARLGALRPLGGAAAARRPREVGWWSPDGRFCTATRASA